MVTPTSGLLSIASITFPVSDALVPNGAAVAQRHRLMSNANSIDFFILLCYLRVIYHASTSTSRRVFNHLWMQKNEGWGACRMSLTRKGR